jgi:hypothetical protein
VSADNVRLFFVALQHQLQPIWHNPVVLPFGPDLTPKALKFEVALDNLHQVVGLFLLTHQYLLSPFDDKVPSFVLGAFINEHSLLGNSAVSVAQSRAHHHWQSTHLELVEYLGVDEVHFTLVLEEAGEMEGGCEGGQVGNVSESAQHRSEGGHCSVSVYVRGHSELNRLFELKMPSFLSHCLLHLSELRLHFNSHLPLVPQHTPHLLEE